MVLGKPHQGEDTGQAGHCGAPADELWYCVGPCPRGPYVPARRAEEHPGRSS